MSDSPILLSWQSLDSYPHERSARWYLAGGIIVLAFAAYGLFEGSWSTTLVALLIGGIYFLLRKEKPRALPVSITGIGIRIGRTLTPWNQLKNFWLLIGPGTAELHFSPLRFLQPEILVFLEKIDPVLVRDTLLPFLPERSGMEERFLDTIAKILKL